MDNSVPILTPDGNHIIWHGPHLDATLTLSLSPAVPGVVFFDMQYTCNWGVHGKTTVNPDSSHDSTMDLVMNQVDSVYMHFVAEDFTEYKNAGKLLQ